MSFTVPGVNGFTRSEALCLTNCSSSRLAYLEKVGLIVPARIGAISRPVVIFSWEQLIGILIVKELRQKTSLGVVKKIVQFLNRNGIGEESRSKQLIVIDSSCFWVQRDWSDFGVIAQAALGRTQEAPKQVCRHNLIVVPPFDAPISTIWEAALTTESINIDSFGRRAKLR
ncbi:MAG: MerR family transcriptional regulator, partial [Cyanobacteria bacterium P01_F01_bin.153]